MPPESQTEVEDERLRQEIDLLVSQLRPDSAHQLLGEETLLGNANTHRAALVRERVIQHLNARRPYRAQRLFTELFEIYFTNDDFLLFGAEHISSLVHRKFVAAFWEAMKRLAFPELAVEVQRRLDELADDELLEVVLRSPDAVALKERMRAEALAHLTNHLSDRKLATELTGHLVALLRQRGKPQHLRDETMAQSLLRFLQACRLLLNGSAAFARWIHRFKTAFPDPPRASAEAEHQAEVLFEANTSLASEPISSGDGNRAGQVLPLWLLNVERRYTVVGAYLRTVGLDRSTGGDQIVEALLGHFIAYSRGLREHLLHTLNLENRAGGAAVRLSGSDRTRLIVIQESIRQIIEALLQGGLDADGRTEPVFRQHLRELTKFIWWRLAPVATDRLASVLWARRRPAPDHADVVWLIQYIWQWHELIEGFGFSISELDRWRSDTVEDLQLVVEKALKYEEGDMHRERLAHLVRLSEIASIFDVRISEWLSVVSKNMANLVMQRLSDTEPLSSHEAVIVRDFLSMARAELKRSRYWRSDELDDLVRLAESAGW